MTELFEDERAAGLSHQDVEETLSSIDPSNMVAEHFGFIYLLVREVRPLMAIWAA